MEKKEYYTERDLEQLGLLSAATLRNQRTKFNKGAGETLPFIKMGKAIRYRRADVERFLREHESSGKLN